VSHGVKNERNLKTRPEGERAGVNPRPTQKRKTLESEKKEGGEEALAKTEETNIPFKKKKT